MGASRARLFSLDRHHFPSSEFDGEQHRDGHVALIGQRAEATCNPSTVARDSRGAQTGSDETTFHMICVDESRCCPPHTPPRQLARGGGSVRVGVGTTVALVGPNRKFIDTRLPFFCKHMLNRMKDLSRKATGTIGLVSESSNYLVIYGSMR